VVLTCFIGCVTGISFGTFVGSAIRKSEGVKTAILLGFSMVMSFLAGLMIGDMKIMIAQKAPILNLINPATLLTDAFYSLYIYESLDRFFLNIGILSIISLGLTAGSFVFIRRERYASI
jgi:ABC-2 type transport system permease protein